GLAGPPGAEIRSIKRSRCGIHSVTSACRKSLAEFAPAGAKKLKSVFSGDMCVRENTSQAASEGFVRLRRTNPARSGLHPARKSGKATFSTVSGHAVEYTA